MKIKTKKKNFFIFSRRILNVNPPMPPGFSPEVADFISRLLVKNPRKRLGGGEDDAEELKRHQFFAVSFLYHHHHHHHRCFPSFYPFQFFPYMRRKKGKKEKERKGDD